MKYKILIFDLDDTLINNEESVKAAFKTMLKEQSLPYTDVEFGRWYNIDRQFWIDWQDGLIEIPDHFKHETGKKSDAFLDWVRSQRVLIYFNDTVDDKRAIKLNHIYMNALTETVVPIDGAQQVLRKLYRDYRVVVATNGPNIATRQKLEKIGCLGYVSDILSADMFGFMKPKIEFFKAIEERYHDYERKDYLVIGDSLKSDVGFAMNAGIDSCWFNKDLEMLDSGYAPTFVVNKLEELIQII